MAAYQVGGVIRFRRPVNQTNPERVINVDEKGRIVSASGDSYTIQLLIDDSQVSGIHEADIEAAIEQPGDGRPGENEEPEANSAESITDDQQTSPNA
jgi:hypothetical protein